MTNLPAPGPFVFQALGGSQWPTSNAFPSAEATIEADRTQAYHSGFDAEAGKLKSRISPSVSSMVVGVIHPQCHC